MAKKFDPIKEAEYFVRAEAFNTTDVNSHAARIMSGLLDSVAADYVSLRRELVTIFGEIQPREGVTWNDAMLARIASTLIDRERKGNI